MVRKEVFKCVSRGINYLYAIVKALDAEESSVHQALHRLEEMNLVVSKPPGYRNIITYELTREGRQSLSLLEHVESGGSAPKKDLVSIYGEDIVRRACEADLIKVVKYGTLEEIVELDPPGIVNIDRTFLKCVGCGGRVDITGHPAYATCTECGQNYRHPGIDLVYVGLRALWGAVKFGVPGALGGGAVGYLVDEEDRNKGAVTGATATGIIAGLLGGVAEAWQAYEEGQQSTGYVPIVR